ATTLFLLKGASITLIQPASGIPGTCITIQGTGFDANKTTCIDFGTQKTITTTFSSLNGTFSTTFICTTQSYGTTLITAMTPNEQANTVFLILPCITFLSPTQGPIGTQITLQGAGYMANGIIRIDFGNTLTITTLITSINGTFSSIFIADNQPTGIKTITALGLQGNQLSTTIFNLIAPPTGSITVQNATGTTIGTYSTIQEGVDACPVGGTVSATAGIYAEFVNISKKIYIVGIGTPTIDPPSDGNAIIFSTNSADGAFISGFRITGATDNTSPYNDGYGIYCSSGSPTITSNQITGNRYGIYCSSSSPVIDNNTIVNNSWHGVVSRYSSFPVIISNTIAESGAYGIYTGDSSSPTIINNIITGNNECGIVCDWSSFPIITNN
ncbi:MAG: right-handed parallel beta-helix repeat-containing protein, partial [Candidatus Desantisbacteria bacterium]